MLAVVDTVLGLATVDLDDERVLALVDGELTPRDPVVTGLPLTVAADVHGPRIVAVMARRPPLVLSDDAGVTWREAGGGLPPGVDVAISPEHPDTVLYATRERLYLSRDGGRFWRALTVELVEITRVEWLPGA
jgi:hypothetical protein